VRHLPNAIALAYAIFTGAVLYVSFAFTVFQWRNPTSNSMSFFRDFGSVAMFKKLPQYQIPAQ
jgi:hypothetical protein